MQIIPHREFRTWVAWRRDQLNNPSRSDYYLMQIAGYVSHVLSSKRWNLKDFVVKFNTDNNREKMSVEQKTEIAKSVWRSRLGKGLPEKTKKTRDRYGR